MIQGQVLWITTPDQLKPDVLTEKVTSLMPSHLLNTVHIKIYTEIQLKAEHSDGCASTYDVIVGRFQDLDFMEMLVEKVKAKLFIIPNAGLTAKLTEKLKACREKFGISVHNVHHNAIATAEVALGLILAASKYIHYNDARLRLGDWTAKYKFHPVVLRDKLALIVGYGAIGKELANMLRFGLKMNVIGVTRTESVERVKLEDTNRVGIIGIERLANYLPQTTVLVLCVPLTKYTSGLIGDRELKLLPEGKSILVNVSRGEVVDERALFENLESRHLFAAGIDVWYQYPDESKASTEEDKQKVRSCTLPSKNFSFEKLDNVVMSPHRGGSLGNPEVEEKRYSDVLSLIIAFAEGKSVPNSINHLLE